MTHSYGKESVHLFNHVMYSVMHSYHIMLFVKVKRVRCFPTEKRKHDDDVYLSGQQSKSRMWWDIKKYLRDVLLPKGSRMQERSNKTDAHVSFQSQSHHHHPWMQPAHVCISVRS